MTDRLTVREIVDAIKHARNALATRKEILGERLSKIDPNVYSREYYEALVQKEKEDFGYWTEVAKTKAGLRKIVEAWKEYAEKNVKLTVSQPMTSEQIRLIQGLQLRTEISFEEATIITEQLASSGAGAYTSLQAVKEVFDKLNIPTKEYNFKDALKSIDLTSDYLLRMIGSVEKDSDKYTLEEIEFFGDYNNLKLNALSEEIEDDFWHYQISKPTRVTVENR